MPPRPYNSFARLHDGVYRFVRDGDGDGPGGRGMRVTVAGGVHGNERIGVKVLDRLRLALLGVAPLPHSLGVGQTAFPVVARGASLTLVYGNPRAIRVGTRGSKPHRDLNRCFPVDVLARDASVGDTFEERRARELAPLLAASDLLLDLHSTNKPSAPFVRVAGFASGIPARLSAIAGRLPCSIVLHDPRFLIGDGRIALTDEFVGAHGGMGVCFESGLASDLSDAKVDAITRGVVDILTREAHAVELIDAAGGRSSRVRSVNVDVLDEPLSQRQVFEITQVFKLSERGFRWADGVGESNFQLVPANQPIGFVGAEPFAVAYDAYIVFPKVLALWKLGA
jgi:hypothetical protein